MIRLLLTSMLLCAAPTLAFSSGSPSCDYPGGSMLGGTRSGTGNFVITANVTNYTPGQPLTVTLRNTSNLLFKGFLLQAVQGSPGTPNVNVIGSFGTPPAGTSLVSGCNGTNGVLTQSSTVAKATVSITWTPPTTATGPITFHAIAVVALGEWYGRQTPITLTLSPSTSSGGGSAGTGGGSAGGASAGGSAGGASAGGSAGGATAGGSSGGASAGGSAGGATAGGSSGGATAGGSAGGATAGGSAGGATAGGSAGGATAGGSAGGATAGGSAGGASAGGSAGGATAGGSAGGATAGGSAGGATAGGSAGASAGGSAGGASAGGAAAGGSARAGGAAGGATAGGAGGMGEEPTGCGCSAFDGSALAMAALLLLARRR